MRSFKVVGPCRVAGVAPGGTVTEQVLQDWGAIIEPLLGVHLEETKAGPTGGKAKGGGSSRATGDKAGEGETP